MENATEVTEHPGCLATEDGPRIAQESLLHLRLLYTFRKLRLQIGSADGLFGIWNNRLDTKFLSGDEREQGLAKLKEKRWAIYLARAVHRYQIWWAAMGTDPLTEQHLASSYSPRYGKFYEDSRPKTWNLGTMIPLDVLMVWHTHMLNPRSYLEDAMRKGRGDLWACGMPWELIWRALSNPNFDYEVLDVSKMAWTNLTGLSWDNIHDSNYVEVTCPLCRAQMRFPWTTCDFQYTTSANTAPSGSASASQASTKQTSNDMSLQERLNIVGHGLADGRPLQTCHSCMTEVDADFLCFYKFIEDGNNLTKKFHAMPSTVLDPRTGMPDKHSSMGVSAGNAVLTAPNRLTRNILYPEANDMLWKFRDGEGKKPTMAALRNMTRQKMGEYMTLATMSGGTLGQTPSQFAASLREKLNGKFATKAEEQRGVFKMISGKASIMVRKLLAQYADNWSPFALDLRAAVLRQSLFIDNMYKFDWLHGVDPQGTVARAVRKYSRFLEVARDNPKMMVVPTLDVDLAWHTHQLNPRSYYDTTTRILDKFMDHDDKVDENKLSMSFEWMCETWYKKYAEIYSECVCWYCEVVRASQTNTLSVLFGSSKRQKSFKDLRDHIKGTSPSDIGPHLSAHNAVKVPFRGASTYRNTRELYIQHVERRRRGLKRANLLVKKHENGPPPKEQHYDHWGYPYLLAGPWVCPLFFDQSMYTSSISNPLPGSGVNADDNIGGCATGCGYLAHCSSSSTMGGQAVLDMGGIIADVFDISNDGGGDGGGCGGCGGGD